MNELRQNARRYRVAEVDGFAIRPTAGRTSGDANPGLTVAVLDSACAWAEDSRFRSETHRGVSNEIARRLARDAAHDRAAELNRLSRLAESR